MKVKVLTRNPDEYLRETKRDIHKVQRNYDPALHPFEAPREYTRALNAVKLDRVFAKPFIGNLEGHKDGVTCLCKHPGSLSDLVSGAYDGEVRIWNLPQKICTRTILAHDAKIEGIAFCHDSQRFITVGGDKTIKIWNSEKPEIQEDEEPLQTIISKENITGISHHRNDPFFATCGDTCRLWEETRNEAIKTFKWGISTLNDVKYNPVQTNLLAACAQDRSIILYDTRETGPLRKIVLRLKTNKIAWNPMEAFIFTCANEENLYTFDTRKLNVPINVHMDHVEAVIDVDYSPTGKEFVSGSYDKSIRIYEADKGHSREVYHTKRMQRLHNVAWSLDNKYILSGSDEMNIRIWKARASEKLGVLKPREKAALHYSDTLKDKFASNPQVKRIARHRQIPKHIYNAQKEQRTIRERIKRKEANRRKHSKKGEVPFVPERRRHVIQEDA